MKFIPRFVSPWPQLRVQVWESIRIKILGRGHSQRNISQTGGSEQVPHYLAHLQGDADFIAAVFTLKRPLLEEFKLARMLFSIVFWYHLFFIRPQHHNSKDLTDTKNVVTCAKLWHLLMKMLMMTNPLCYTRTGAEMQNIDPSHFTASSHRLVTMAGCWSNNPQLCASLWVIFSKLG